MKPCVLDAKPILVLSREGLLGLVPSLFQPVYVTPAVYDEILTPSAKEDLNLLIRQGLVVPIRRDELDVYEQASYDGAFLAMKDHMTDNARSPKSNLGEMTAVAMAIAKGIPAVVMDDWKAEAIIRKHIGWDEDDVVLFRSSVLAKAGVLLKKIPRKVGRAVVKTETGRALEEQTEDADRLTMLIVEWNQADGRDAKTDGAPG